MSMSGVLGNLISKVAAEKQTTKAKILHILKTHITMPEGTDPDEVYAEMIVNHIHKYFVLKEEE